MQDLTTTHSMAPHPDDFVHQAVPNPVAAQIGPRRPGTVYYDGLRLLEVVEVITDPAEARILLHRDSAQFAILVRDLHADYQYFTGAAWTDNHRVEKSVAQTETTRIDMAGPDGDAIRNTVQTGGHLELHDSTRPDVAPIVMDDFLMAVMRGEVA